MSEQVCEYDVDYILEKIGDENILLQLDGYESYLNAIKKIDVDGHINEVTNPGDTTDLCSTIDQELGAIIKKDFTATFDENFEEDPDRWIKGEVSARERRRLFTFWTCDAIAKLMSRRDIIRRAFRATGVGIDIDGIMRHHIKFPHFATYVPPEKDEEHNDELLTVAEIDLLAAQEKKFQEELKKKRKKQKDAALRLRAKGRARNITGYYRKHPFSKYFCQIQSGILIRFSKFL